MCVWRCYNEFVLLIVNRRNLSKCIYSLGYKYRNVIELFLLLFYFKVIGKMIFVWWN